MHLRNVIGLALAAGLAASSAAKAQTMDFVAGFARLDLNHDGLITRAEFIATRHPRFVLLDRNGDHYLTLADIPAFASYLPQAEEARAMLARCDVDHDGRVSEAEFVACSLAVFDAADLNHDGVLTMEEARLARNQFRRP